MAYIGKQPVVGNFVKLDAITTSATTTFNLTNGGVAYFPQTANNCIVSLNGVIQSPTSAYTISGSTIVFSDALTASDSIDFILVLGDVLNIGTPSDGTITSAKLASGTDGLFAWQSVQTTGFTAVAARAYPCNTTSSAFTVTLPASPSVGDQVLLLDYAGTFATNNITLGRNSNKIEGGTLNKVLTTNREAVTLVYVDSTQGWVASSGTNFGSQSLDPILYSADYLIVAGGGGGGNSVGGGGGAGGLLTGTTSLSAGTVYTITVGSGGTGGSPSTNGGDSSITGLTTAVGGGKGNGFDTSGSSGGSGGGGGGSNTSNRSGGSGTSGQGNAGGGGATSPAGQNSTGDDRGSGGGGGAGAVGGTGTTNGNGAVGGAGTASSITGSSVTYAGGGGGNGDIQRTGGAGGAGGGGRGGDSNSSSNGTAGTTNTGGGGGCHFNGGSGVVIISVPTANYSATSTGSPTVTTSGSNTILKFTGSGSYTG
jgi:hypothetical protein